MHTDARTVHTFAGQHCQMLLGQLFGFEDAERNTEPHGALIIDDDPTTRSLVARLITAMDAKKVLEADNGLDGLNLVFSDAPPDFVICDMGMEPMDGMAVVAAIRATQRADVSDVPVIVFTREQDPKILKMVKSTISKMQ